MLLGIWNKYSTQTGKQANKQQNRGTGTQETEDLIEEKGEGELQMMAKREPRTRAVSTEGQSRL